MSKNKTNPAIPEWIVREEDKKNFSHKLHSALYGCTESYKKLMNMKDFVLSRNPKNLCVEDVNKIVDERIKDVSETKMLTFDGKQQAIIEWENIRTKAIGYIQKIHCFFDAYPDAIIDVVDDSLVCSNFDMLLFEHCKIKTPDNVYRHFELIEKVKVAIKELQDFEQKEDYPTGDLVNVEIDLRLSKDPQQLIENWLWQIERKAILKKSSDFQASIEIQKRKEKAMQQAFFKEREEQYKRDHPDDYRHHI